MIGKLVKTITKEIVMLPANVAYGVSDGIEEIVDGKPKKGKK